MKIILRNRITKFLGKFDLEEASELYRFHPDNYWFAPAYKSRRWDGFIRPFSKISQTVPTGLFVAKLEQFRDTFPHAKIVDKRVLPAFHDFDQVLAQHPEWTLHASQDEAVRIMIENAVTGGLILSATGTGKTRVSGAFFKTLKGTGMFMVNKITLLEQAAKALAKIVGEEIGIIGKSILKIRRINVATSQTVNLHLHDPDYMELQNNLDALIIDELHKNLSKRNFESIRNMKPKAVYGLTATLHLQQEHVAFPAYMLCGKVLFEYHYEQAREDKIVANGVIIGIDFNRNIYHKWKDAYDKFIVRGKQRNGYIVALCKEAIKRKLKVLILTERVDHVRILRKRLEEAGVVASEVWGGVKTPDRNKILRLFEKGVIKVVVANVVWKEGIDIPSCDVVIDAANFVDWADPQQKFGRGTRITKEKQSFIYLDIGDRKPEDGLNPFVKGTRARRKALVSLGVPLIERLATATPKQIFDEAQGILVK